MKLEFKPLVRPALILFIICLAASLALAAANAATANKITEVQLALAEQSRQVVFPEAETFTQRETFHIAEKAGKTIGYVFETESKGYGGSIRVMTGIDAEGKVTGVVLLSHAETPGLGANAEKAAFTDQYKQPLPQDGFTVTKNQASNGQVQAVTGATISSDAVTSAVNQAIAQYYALKEGQ